VSKAVLFDLFGTLVHFTAEVPTRETGETGQKRWKQALRWLEPVVRTHLPECSFGTFLDCLLVVTNEIVASRAPEYREIPSEERFRLALARLGLDPRRQETLAPLLAAEHMANLTKHTEADAFAVPTLTELRGKGYRLGVVSNFDSESAAWQVLERHGLLPHLDAVLISASFGRRKPHPSIFLAGLARLGASPREAWFVGDSYEEDILGADHVGLPSIWVCSQDPAPSDRDRGVNTGRSRRVQSLAEVLRCIEQSA